MTSRFFDVGFCCHLPCLRTVDKRDAPGRLVGVSVRVLLILFANGAFRLRDGELVALNDGASVGVKVRACRRHLPAGGRGGVGGEGLEAEAGAVLVHRVDDEARGGRGGDGECAELGGLEGVLRVDIPATVCDTISGLGITHGTVAASGGFNRTIWSFLRVKGATFFLPVARQLNQARLDVGLQRQGGQTRLIEEEDATLDGGLHIVLLCGDVTRIGTHEIAVAPRVLADKDHDRGEIAVTVLRELVCQENPSIIFLEHGDWGLIVTWQLRDRTRGKLVILPEFTQHLRLRDDLAFVEAEPHPKVRHVA